MNSRKVFRKAKGDFLRAAAGAAVLIVTAISTAALWAIAASGSGAPPASSPQPIAAKASVSLVDLALTVGGVLVALMVVVLTVNYARRRFARRRPGSRRGGTHVKASGPGAEGAIRSVAGRPPGPYALHPDHPSWPGRPDPRWAATESILLDDGYSNWPERQGSPWPNAASPVSENGPPGDAAGARQKPSSAHSRGPDRMRAAHPELTLAVRVLGDPAPHANRGQPDAPGVHQRRHKPQEPVPVPKTALDTKTIRNARREFPI